jgi:hypothetical protein
MGLLLLAGWLAAVQQLQCANIIYWRACRGLHGLFVGLPEEKFVQSNTYVHLALCAGYTHCLHLLCKTAGVQDMHNLL